MMTMMTIIMCDCADNSNYDECDGNDEIDDDDSKDGGRREW